MFSLQFYVTAPWGDGYRHTDRCIKRTRSFLYGMYL